jgi:hypothetical protein
MTAHPSVDATLLDLADEGAPAARVCGYLNDSRPREDVSESDVLWCLRQADHLQVIVDGIEEIRADVDETGEVRYPVVDATGERVCSARDVRALLADEPFTVTHVAESRFDDGLRADGGQSGGGTDRIECVECGKDLTDPKNCGDPETPPAWKKDTSATNIKIDVQLHDEGYQTDEKWTVHCTDRLDNDDELIAGFAVEHTNKGNYWCEGGVMADAVDFADLPLRARQRVAAVLNRDLDAITPEVRTVRREDGTELADHVGDTQ